MSEIILPPNLPVEVEREIALALLAAGTGDRVRAVREVVKRHEDSFQRAWTRAVPQAMRALHSSWVGILQHHDVGDVLDGFFGIIPLIILVAVYQAREKHEARRNERARRAENFDSSISGRPSGKTRERLFYTPAVHAFSRAKRGQL